MITGTLGKERFAFYIRQDAHYLLYFGRALSAIAARLPRQEHALQFMRFAEGAIEVERALQIVDEIAPFATENMAEQMTASYLKACRLKWLFWESTYRLERRKTR